MAYETFSTQEALVCVACGAKVAATALFPGVNNQLPMPGGLTVTEAVNGIRGHYAETNHITYRKDQLILYTPK